MDDQKESNAHVAIYTPEFLVHGYVKMKLKKIGDHKVYSKRMCDIINAASERMAGAGEPSFLELKNASIRDIRSRKFLGRTRSLVINKSSIRLIIRGEYVTQGEDEV